ncbi:MAG: hypothetical protein J1F03_01260 [Oscillospiraceae bacterium]|nr:hypothetical protein [Oscillospiraceae bacterium]
MTALSKCVKQLLSNDKARKIIIACGLGIMLLLLLSSFFTGNSSKSKAKSDDANYAIDCAELERKLEERLCELILQIDGVGKVSVMVTVDTTERVIYEKNNKSESKNQVYSEEREVVLAGSSKEPLEVGKIMPVVRSAAIVCEGAADPVIRERVANIASKALNIGISKVYVAY